MKTNKDLKIKEYLDLPIKVGDSVIVRGLGIQNETRWGSTTNVLEVLDDDSIVIKNYSREVITKDNYKKSTYHLGTNPFQDNSFQDKIRVLNIDIGGLLSYAGYDKNSKIFNTEIFGKVVVPELDFDPYVIDKSNSIVHYQRSLVWSNLQKERLIDSIYKNQDIGKFVIRKRSWETVETNVNLGLQTAFKDCVDGKQRLNALLEFVENKFTDSYGNYWDDLSENAQNRFMNTMNLTYLEMSEATTDKDVVETFLNINIAGVKIDEEHINFIKTIKI